MRYLKNTLKSGVDKHDKIENGCWIHRGTPSHRYAFFNYENSRMYAHRASYELHHGKIPEGLHVCHTCDTPKCVNPDHLFAGTKQENHADMMEKGRNAKGEKSGHSKLTSENVREIRENINVKGRHFAKIFGVSDATISLIRSRKNWKGE